MISDNERREVARKLRLNAGTALHMNTSDDFAREVFRAAMDESTVDYRAAIDRLADLIDPGDGTKAVDRDALLELADEMETADPEDLRVAIDYVTECASCIRKRLRVKQ